MLRTIRVVVGRVVDIIPVPFTAAWRAVATTPLAAAEEQREADGEGEEDGDEDEEDDAEGDEEGGEG